MSGVAGADRVKSRQDFKQFLASYQHLLSKFPGFVSMTPSGSYNSNPNKQDFGDIDLVVHIQSDKDKATIKKELQAFFTKMPETVIVPFSSAKHAGKRTYNAGELVSVRYHDDALGYSAQVDNIVALDAAEASFKQSFLDMPAEEQGLILGLTKIATIETDPAILFQKLGIKIKEPLSQDQEYEFNLSGVELQLRRVTYEPGTFKQANREVLWSSKNFNDVQKLLFQYDLTAGFDDLLQQCKRNIRNPRSGERMKGVFASMISVKSGEVGTAKGAGKEAALAKIQQTFKENRSIFRSLMENGNKKIVFAFGRFQPPTIGHELLITSVKHIAEQQGADHAIYVSKTQDHKSNPLSVEQKIAYLRKMFPGVNFVACDATVRTPIEAAKVLNGKYQELIMVAGSDRVANFEKLLNDYNGKEYQYAMLRVVSAGERDPDSDDVSGMSGTKMRAAAVAGDLQTFMQGLPGTISEKDAMNLMELIKQGLQKPVKAKKGVAEGQQDDPEDYRAHLIKTLPAMMNYFAKTGKGWSPSKEQMLAAVDTAYEVMKHTSDVQQAGKALMDELNTLHRMSQGQQGVAEGLSKRDQQDVAAIRATIERLQAQLKQPNADKAAIQQSIAHEQKRLALYKEGVAEGSEEDSYSNKFVQSQIDYYKKHLLSGNTGDQHRIRGSLMNYERIKNQRIKNNTWQEQGVAEGEADYGADYQDKVKRLSQMAKQGERKTVWDPIKRVYKTVPVNPPKEQGVNEKMMPASTFAGSKKNKLGPAGQLKGSMKRPARAGDLVGGSAEESFDGGSYAAKKPGYSGEANYTAQPNWRGQNIGEDVDVAMANAIARLIESQLK